MTNCTFSLFAECNTFGRLKSMSTKKFSYILKFTYSYTCSYFMNTPLNVKFYYYRDFALPSKISVNSSAKPAKRKTEVLCVLEDKDTEEYDYSVLVLGVTGVGKSTMCNFFFNFSEDDNVFGAVEGMVPGTPQCYADCHSIGGQNIMFIDSPGFADARPDNHKQMQEMGKALLLARNGVNAIVVCLNGAGRFTDADKSFLKELEQLEANGSNSVWDYTFLVFTHGLNMGKDEQHRYAKIDKWKADPKCSPLFLKLLDKVQNRLMVLESLNDDTEYYRKKCDEFVKLIQLVSTKNKQKCYTHKLFVWARDKYGEAAKKQKQRIDTETEHQENFIKSYLEMLKQKDEHILQLENEKKESAKQQKETEDELHRAEIELKDNEHKIDQYEKNIETMRKNETIKIQDAQHKLERIRQEKRTLEEMVENKKNECKIQQKTISEKQNAIEREISDKEQIQEQLQKERILMEKLKLKTQRLLVDRKIIGDTKTLDDALELVTKEMDKRQEELTVSKDEIDRTKQELTAARAKISTKEDAVTQLTEQVESYSTRGIPIPFTRRKIITGPRY